MSDPKQKVAKPMAQLPYPPCQYCAGEGCVVCNLSGYDFKEQVYD